MNLLTRRCAHSDQVLLGHPYNVSIDMWSLGCMAAELFLGLPLFPGASEHDLLVRIIEMLGMPPDSLLEKAKHSKKYFQKEEPTGEGQASPRTRYKLRTQAEFESLLSVKAPAGIALSAPQLALSAGLGLCGGFN